MKILDLSAMQCGMETGEFKNDDYFYGEMTQIIQHIETLHEYMKKMKT